MNDDGWRIRPGSYEQRKESVQELEFASIMLHCRKSHFATQKLRLKAGSMDEKVRECAIGSGKTSALSREVWHVPGLFRKL